MSECTVLNGVVLGKLRGIERREFGKTEWY